MEVLVTPEVLAYLGETLADDRDVVSEMEEMTTNQRFIVIYHAGRYLALSGIPQFKSEEESK